MIPPTSAIRASVLYGLLAAPYLGSVSAADAPLRPRAPHIITSAATAQAAGASVTAVSECHFHDGKQFCQAGPTEFRIEGTATASSYTGCHAHGSVTACWAPGRTAEVEIYLAAENGAVTSTPTQSPAADASSITAITSCHLHDADLVCMGGATEYKVQTSVTATTDLPPTFTGCHADDQDLHCEGPDGKEVTATVYAEDDHEEEHSESETGGQNCHFHAGVEHCTGGSGEKIQTCERVQRDYNIKLRVGLLFVMLVTSSIGVFTPILISSFVSPKNIAFTILRQFGTGVVISTAFVHLYTHAVLMFQNECLGDLGFESTASAILMAGLFLSFLVEYLGMRYVQWHQAKERARHPESAGVAQTLKSDMVNISVLEAGIIFHSLLIGLTLVVAGDAFFGTLFAVIVFHQMFEGIALGTRIAALGRGDSASPGYGHGHGHHVPAHPHYHPEPKSQDQIATTDGVLPVPHQSKGREEVSSDDSDGAPTTSESVAHVSMRKKLLLAAAFALVTPIGMAIGIGTLHQFNGNDPSTVIAIGTLDAFSAGILVWVGIVEMLAHDWMLGGEMAHSGPGKTLLGLGALMLGMGIMSLLGKWA